MRSHVALLSLLAAAVLLAGDPPGIPPRAAADYAAHASVNGVTLAASVVPAAQVKRLFSKDLDHAGYIVVEVAVIPDSGTTADFGSDEFTLKVGTDPTILAAQTPRAVAGGDKQNAAAKTKVPQLPDKVHVYNTETVGYESGGYGRKGGVYTESSTTVAVGDRPAGYDPRCDPTYGGGPPVGGDPRMGRYPAGCGPAPNPQPPKPPKDTSGLRKELEDKALPEGKTALAVAGYLYFVRPSTKQKNPDYQLTWYRVAGEVTAHAAAAEVAAGIHLIAVGCRRCGGYGTRGSAGVSLR